MKCFVVFMAATVLGIWEDTMDTGSLDGYFNKTELYGLMATLANEFPDLDITKNSLPSGSDYLIVTARTGISTKANVIVSSGQFTGFPNGPQMVAYLMSKLAYENATESINSLLLRTTIYFVPFLNPVAFDRMEENFENDGFAKYYTNLRDTACESGVMGANLNRNWAKGFSTYGESGLSCTVNYGGAAALTEAETLFLSSSLIGVKPFAMWIHYDRSGQNLKAYSYNSSLAITDVDVVSFYEYLEGALEVSLMSAQEAYGEAESGTLIDYAVSKGMGSIEIGLPKDTDEIKELLADHAPLALELISLASYHLKEFSVGLTGKDCGPEYTCALDVNGTYSLYTLSFTNYGMTDDSFFDFNITTPGKPYNITTINVKCNKLKDAADRIEYTREEISASSYVFSGVIVPSASTCTFSVYIEMATSERRELSLSDGEVTVIYYPYGLTQDGPLTVLVDTSTGSESAGYELHLAGIMISFVLFG